MRVWGIAWSPDGQQLAAGCEDNNLYVWRAETGLRQFTLKRHRGAIDSLGFDARGELLFTSSWDGTTRLWDARTGAHLLVMRAKGLSFVGDSSRLAMKTLADEVTVEIAEIVQSDTLLSLVGRAADAPRDGCRRVVISGDGRWIANASTAGVRIWDLVRGEQVAFLPVRSDEGGMVFHPDGRALICVDRSDVLRWPLEADADTIRIGPPEVLLRGLDDVRNIAFAGGRTLVLILHRGHALVLDPDDPRQTSRIGPHERMRYLSVSPEDKWLATGAWHTGSKNVKIWDLAGGELVHEIPIDGSVNVCFSPDGKWLVTGEVEHTLWRTGTWEAVARFSVEGSNSVPGPIAFSPDGRLLALSPWRPWIELVDLARLERIARLQCPGEVGFESLGFTPDGTRLVFPNKATGYIIYVWDLRALRTQLAALDLDWDLPPYPPAPPVDGPSPRLVKLDLGHLASQSASIGDIAQD
jgi:WD40 repeat protein